MRQYRAALALFLLLAVVMLTPIKIMAAPAGEKPLIYDDAGLLNQEEIGELNALANELGAERETDIIIVTSSNVEGADVVEMTQDFYDEHAPGYDKAHGNAVILMMDMNNREVYLAGFYKAEEYLDNERLDKIRNRITSELTSGSYKRAFEKYIKTAHNYMGYEPGVNPDNILYNLWFQLAASISIGAIVVVGLVYRSGGRVTVNAKTYEDAGASGILDRQDRYIRTTVTKRKIPKNNSSGRGGGGGGGMTRGGHSHSGSRGSF